MGDAADGTDERVEQVRAACADVRAGAWRDRVVALGAAVDDGVRVAAVPLAEIAAFQGDWARVAELTELTLSAWPDPLYAGNVVHTHAGLLLRAGTQVSFPVAVAGAFLRLLDEVGDGPTGDALRAHAGAAADLAAGRPVRLTLPTSTQPSGKDLPHQESAALLTTVTPETATAELRNALVRKRFRLAMELRRRFPGTASADLFPVLALASWQARTGSPNLAWALVAEHLPGWLAVDPFTVAPVELLVDDDLFALVTPQRGIDVLDTPRDRGGFA